ncbi:hypothetical protein SKAU_G00133810 [Synaphobranchus kaupii]|uniref:Leprecan-like alpha-helical domain-containing protein n=1 Tax=Synaphobranchus kaupii TaxID=118154 RepID=A0A9Q1J3R4_SYNKA|nr:hypothetical protein SKAU_G00133810 [Synaphobranchus kaupii]
MASYAVSIKRALLPSCLYWALVAAGVNSQYETYSFKSFPKNELMPLEYVYEQALDQYVAKKWKDSIKYFELSLRLYRLLKDCEIFCSQNCSYIDWDSQDTVLINNDLQVLRHILLRASCLKKCKENFPVFKLPYPRREVLDVFEKRAPYQYMQVAYYQLNNLEKAVSAAHTFLQRNPDDTLMTKSMDYYKTMFDLEEYLIDHEERPYEGMFLKSVKLFNVGDFSSSVRGMEQAASEYFKVYNLCLAGCEGAQEVTHFKDLYPFLADLYIVALKCKVKCEGSLIPNVGGYVVEKFVATMYHYLQFAYYKLNDAQNAAPCAASYMIFDPEDQIMQHNIAYYDFYSEQWGLEERHFKPRLDAVRHYNQTTTQKKMLEFAENYLRSDDEDVVNPEEVVIAQTGSPDIEFEGVGDYEESFYADWWQEPKTKGDTGESDS